MSIYWPLSVFDDARQMPEFRAGLRDLAVPEGFWHQAERYRQMNDMTGNQTGVSVEAITADREQYERIAGPTGHSPVDLSAVVNATLGRVENSMRWNREAIEHAQLLWVSDALCDVVYGAHESVPDDTVLTPELPPSPYGLVLFQTPFVGLDSGTEFESVRVDAVLWGPIRLPSRTDWLTSTEYAADGFAFAAFRWMDPRNHTDPAARKLAEQFSADRHDESMLRANWVPLGRSDWVVGDELTVPTHDLIHPESKVHESMIEDRRLVAALWSLVRQHRLVERTTVLPIKQARKRLDRRGDRTGREVEVVHLRRPEYRPRHEDGSTERRMGVRFPVRPHWRNQACGPNRSERRLILVPPHWKGPEDGPVVNTERIWSLDQ